MQATESLVPRAAARARRIDLRVVVGLLLMVLAVGGTASLIRRAQSRVPVLVAARAVDEGAVVRSADLKPEDMSVSSGISYLPASRQAAVVGKVATERLWPGKLISEASVTGADKLPAGHVAMSLALKTDRAAGGQLRSGDRVAVISSPSKEAAGTQAETTILFADVPVLSVRKAETAEGGGVVVTLRLLLEEARSVAEARSFGDIDLVLRSGAPQ